MANVCPGAKGTLESSIPTNPARSRRHLNTWMGLHREPQERLENETGLPKVQSLSPPSHLQLCTVTGTQLGTTWGRKGDNTDYLVLSGTIGGFQHLGCRRGTRGKVGLGIVTTKSSRGSVEHLGQGNGPGGLLLSVPLVLPLGGLRADIFPQIFSTTTPVPQQQYQQVHCRGDANASLAMIGEDTWGPHEPQLPITTKVSQQVGKPW